jgi:hypothetical protein
MLRIINMISRSPSGTSQDGESTRRSAPTASSRSPPPRSPVTHGRAAGADAHVQRRTSHVDAALDRARRTGLMLDISVWFSTQGNAL